MSQWFVHLEQMGGVSVVGPYNHTGAVEMAGMMVANRDAQGYEMLKRGEERWESRTHNLVIEVKDHR